jgi:hypothetical protein
MPPTTSLSKGMSELRTACAPLCRSSGASALSNKLSYKMQISPSRRPLSTKSVDGVDIVADANRLDVLELELQTPCCSPLSSKPSRLDGAVIQVALVRLDVAAAREQEASCGAAALLALGRAWRGGSRLAGKARCRRGRSRGSGRQEAWRRSAEAIREREYRFWFLYTAARRELEHCWAPHPRGTRAARSGSLAWSYRHAGGCGCGCGGG